LIHDTNRGFTSRTADPCSEEDFLSNQQARIVYYYVRCGLDACQDTSLAWIPTNVYNTFVCSQELADSCCKEDVCLFSGTAN